MKTTLEHVRECLESGESLTPYEMQARIQAKGGPWIADSALTARIRQLRDSDYGGFTILTERITGKRSVRYRMVVKPEQLNLLEVA